MYVFRENFPLILGHKVTSKSILQDSQKAQKAYVHQTQEDTMQLQEYKFKTQILRFKNKN